MEQLKNGNEIRELRYNPEVLEMAIFAPLRNYQVYVQEIPNLTVLNNILKKETTLKYYLRNGHLKNYFDELYNLSKMELNNTSELISVKKMKESFIQFRIENRLDKNAEIFVKHIQMFNPV